jgi:hypothetical protein
MEGDINSFLKLLYNIFGILFFLLIIVCLLSLGRFLYFFSAQKDPVPSERAEERFSKTIEETVGADHFHILDETVYTDIENAPMCLQCHGNFCHTKSEALRSYYNMHTFFMACETCHIRANEGEKISFHWFDDKTGAIVKALRGKDGNYGAKIVPVKQEAGERKRLDEFPKMELALKYLELQHTLTEKEKEAMQTELMQHISEEEITCEECHRKDTYINYGELGYGRKRAAELARIEIVKMLQEYGDFYLPSMLDLPGMLD